MTLLFIDIDFSPIYIADSGSLWTFSFVFYPFGFSLLLWKIKSFLFKEWVI